MATRSNTTLSADTTTFLRVLQRGLPLRRSPFLGADASMRAPRPRSPDSFATAPGSDPARIRRPRAARPSSFAPRPRGPRGERSDPSPGGRPFAMTNQRTKDGAVIGVSSLPGLLRIGLDGSSVVVVPVAGVSGLLEFQCERCI